jgi:small subunit ribosomal protein S5
MQKDERKPNIERKERRRPVKEVDPIASKLVSVNRVTKVVKGGRNMRFAALVVAGDGNGRVGVGSGKAAEVPSAIDKATLAAKKSMVKVALHETTIPHEVIGVYGKSRVKLLPSKQGNGIIAGGSVRPVLELAGYRDIRTKVVGTNNPRNVVYATIEGLKAMQTAEQVAKKRGKKVEEIL